MYDYNLIKQISDEIGTPFQIIDIRRFRNNLTSFKKAFLRYYPKFIISYSFKTNYTFPLLNEVREIGGYAETVSAMEYEMALKLGYDPEHIIFNGPIKTFEIFVKAIEDGSIVNLDSEYEIEYLKKIRKSNPTLPIKIGLRINMSLNTNNGESAIQAGLKESRFGFTSDILDEIIPELRSLDIKVCSLHGHTSSYNRVTDNYRIIAKTLMSVGEKYNLNCIEYIDFGGGFFGAAPEGVDVKNKPTYEDYAKAICDELMANHWFMKYKPNIVIEPGTSVVCNVFELVTKIYQHKVINNTNYVYVDASIFMVRPQTSKANYPFEIFSENHGENAINVNIVGSTCMEVDIIANDVKLTHYKNGDYMVIRGNGAYRNNMTPFFINSRVPIVELENDSYKVVRGRQTADEMLDLLCY